MATYSTNTAASFHEPGETGASAPSSPATGSPAPSSEATSSPATDAGTSGSAAHDSGAPGSAAPASDGPAQHLRETAGKLQHHVVPHHVAPEIDPVMACENVDVYYGEFRAVTNVSLEFGKNEITALIGPSGCGKSTLIRSLNRMNDLVEGARVEGRVTYHDKNIYDRDVDPIEVRRRIGMVFQKPNPFPKSIYDNVAYGPRVTGMKVDSMDDLVEESLSRAALWDEVKDKLKQSAFGLSGGQQQRLCIARTLAVRPDVILMDEPASALDPIATARIEDLMLELREDYAIIVVTHNMQQAARVADRTAFFTALAEEGTGDRTGLLVEYDLTSTIFQNPRDKRTEDYISGRFG